MWYHREVHNSFKRKGVTGSMPLAVKKRRNSPLSGSKNISETSIPFSEEGKGRNLPMTKISGKGDMSSSLSGREKGTRKF